MACWLVFFALHPFLIPPLQAASVDGASRSQEEPDRTAFREAMVAGVQLMRGGDFSGAAARFTEALSLRPTDLRAAVQLGRAYLAGGDLDAAQAAYERVADSHPEVPAGPFGLGQVRWARRDVEGAVEAFRRALTIAPDHYGSLYYLGQAMHVTESFDEARRLYRRAIEVNPQVRLAPLALARLEIEHGEPAVAVDVLEALEPHWPDDSEVLTALGASRALAGQRAAAREALRHAVELEPGRADAWHNLGMLAFNQQSWGEAEEALREALRSAPRHGDARLLLAELLETTGRPLEAEALLKEGVEVDPKNRKLQRGLGMLLASHSGESARAIEIFTGLLQKNPEDDESRRALAEIHVGTGDLTAALEQYEVLAQRYPENPDLAYQVGFVRSRTGPDESARVAFEKALELAPDFIDAEYELALLDLRGEEFAEAADHLGRVIAADPYRTAAFFNLGKALRSLGRVDEARQMLQRFEELSAFDDRVMDLRGEIRGQPAKVENYLALARLYLEAERLAEARMVLEQVLRVDPTSAAAKKLLAELGQAGTGPGSG